MFVGGIGLLGLNFVIFGGQFGLYGLNPLYNGGSAWFVWCKQVRVMP